MVTSSNSSRSSNIIKFIVTVIVSVLLSTAIWFQYFPMGRDTFTSLYPHSHLIQHFKLLPHPIQLPPLLNNYILHNTNHILFFNTTSASHHFSQQVKNQLVEKVIIFYPGARVQSTSYIPLLYKIALETNSFIFICNFPFHMPLFFSDCWSAIIEQKEYKNIVSNKQIILMGHSTGSLAIEKSFSSMYNLNTTDSSITLKKVSKFISLGGISSAYSIKEIQRKYDLKMLYIWGTQDSVINFRERIEPHMNNLYDTELTTVVKCNGCNHANFGYYGEQFGDSEALISKDKQIQIAIDSISQYINTKENKK